MTFGGLVWTTCKGIKGSANGIGVIIGPHQTSIAATGAYTEKNPLPNYTSCGTLYTDTAGTIIAAETNIQPVS